jgi:predicted amidohydrolase
VSTLRVALVQQASALDPVENVKALDVVADLASRRPAGERPDLVVFPEAFARDFGPPGSDISPFAESVDGAEPFVQAMVGLAGDHDVTVLAGMFERSTDPARPYNTLVVADRSGAGPTYRKIHLYDSFGYRESDRLLAGDLTPVVTEMRGVKVGLMTCYDLRFPELARELVAHGAQLLVVPAAWVAGERKVDHWQTLVRARAIENTVFVAAVGQPGPRYCGHSLVVGPMGEVLADTGDGPAVVEAVIDTEVLDRARATNPSLANRRF